MLASPRGRPHCAASISSVVSEKQRTSYRFSLTSKLGDGMLRFADADGLCNLICEHSRTGQQGGVDLGGGKHGYAGGIRGRPTPDASPNPSPSPTPTPTPDPDQVWATRCARPRRRGGRSACTASCATARAGASRAPPEPEP